MTDNQPTTHASALTAALAPNNTKMDAGHPDLQHSLQPSDNRQNGLPTPPNSLSPTIHPQKASPAVAVSTPLILIDCDVELKDASDDSTSPSLDATGDITPTLLAKHHLPEVLLQNGPLAIRYVLAHLTSTVPGFAGIPAAKARRIVVAALENKTGGGLDGDVVFEKVGWGRWDARYRNQPRRDSARHMDDSEDEADNMSLDGDDVPRKIRIIAVKPAPDDSDATDEEDWSMEPERPSISYAASYNSRRDSHCSSMMSRPVAIPLSRSLQQNMKPRKVSAAMTSLASLDGDTLRGLRFGGGILPFKRAYSSSLTQAIRAQSTCGSPQEVEAVEALLAMSYKA